MNKKDITKNENQSKILESKHKDDVLGYDINTTDVFKTREVTVKCNGNRFRILMELAQGCYGNCSGCSLSTTDRGTPKPIDMEMVKNHLNAFVPVINEKRNLRTTVVNYGVGDYFLFNADILENLSSVTRVFFSALKTQRNVISLSTSLLCKPEKMFEKVARIKKHLHQTQVVFDAVIDPERIKEHFDEYNKNLVGITNEFSFVDIVINIHKGLTKENAYWVHKFATHSKVLNLDIQYAVNKDNRYRVQVNPEDFDEFWGALSDSFSSKDDKDKITMSIANPTINDDLSLYELISKNIEMSINERMLVDSNGNIWSVGFGFGDVLLDQRYNLPPIGKITDGRVIINEKNIKALKRALLTQASSNICSSCTHVKKCYGTGYGWYQLQTDNPNKCGNPARKYFESNF